MIGVMLAFRAIESYELPYLDPVRFLPQEMVAHLAPSTKKALSPQVRVPGVPVPEKIAKVPG